MRKKQQWGDCELELLSFQASKLPYDVSLDIIDDAGNGDCHLMLIVREDMYSKQNAEFLLKSYEKLVKSFVSTPNITFVEPDMFEAQDVERALQFGRSQSSFSFSKAIDLLTTSNFRGSCTISMAVRIDRRSNLCYRTIQSERYGAQAAIWWRVNDLL